MERNVLSVFRRNFSFQYVDGSAREGAKLDLLLGNKEGQVTEVLVRDHFGTGDHNSIRVLR